MTFIIETIEADLPAVFATNQVVTANENTTFFGTLDVRQLPFDTTNTQVLGLDTTNVRSDIYALDVDPGGSLSIELAIDGAFGGDLDQFGFIIAGDNGTSVVGQPLDQSGWSILANSTATTGNFFQQTFDTANHEFIYVVISVDSDDIGTYSLSAADTLAALGDDIVAGTDGVDDVLFGLRGDDAIDGMGGSDTAAYQQVEEVFTLRLGSQIQLIDRAGNEGTDTLTNIEVLDFENSEFELFRFDDVASLTPEQFSSFTEMYIAYFNRAPDSAGLMFWANAFATGTTIEEIATLFSVSAEAQALYPADAPSSTFVEAIYTNVLGRASDAGGAEFWTGVLEAGTVTRGEFVLEILRGARAEAPDGATPEFIAQQAVDVAFLDNKIDVGIYFSAILGMSNVQNATDVMALYDGSAASSNAAREAADIDFAAAQASDGTGEFLIQLTGVVDDPFLIS